MQLNGEQKIDLPIETTWNMLNDPAVLQRCIVGCEELQQQSAHQYKVVLQATVGPVKARFGGSLDVSDVQPPRSYTLTFEGSAGAMGFGRGSAKVNLEPTEDSRTILRYEVDASVGGKVAQVGSRLIEGVARKMADSFFARFQQEAAQGAIAQELPHTRAESPAASGVSVPGSGQPSRRPWYAFWVLGLLAAAVATWVVVT